MRPVGWLLFQLLFGYALACVCFLFGVSIHGWQFWLSLTVTFALAFRQSPRTGWWVLGLNALVFVLTMFTFTYQHCDAATCHLPLARFLQEGWNPVRELTSGTVEDRFASYGITRAEDPKLDFHILHILIAPKFVHVLAAQMQAGCRLFTAAGYPLWALFIVLMTTAWRLGREVLRAPRWAAGCLAVLVSCNPEIMQSSFQGQLDYVTYAALGVAGLSLPLWCNGRRREDLVVFFSAVAIASVSRFNGLLLSILYVMIAAWKGRRDRDLRRGLLLFAAVMVVLAILPYWTSAWWFGSPLYPMHTFRAGVPLPDLTADFRECNEAARSMGYVARMTYAYVWRDLAVVVCRLLSGNPTFEPVWQKPWLADGWKALPCLVLWSSLALLFVRRIPPMVKAVCAVTFLAFFLTPVKFIGYPRYVCQVYLAIVLGWFAFACNASGYVRHVLLAFGVVSAACIAFHTVYEGFGCQLWTEGAVQRSIASIKRSGEPYSISLVRDKKGWMLHQETWSYVLKDRFAAANTPIGINAPGYRLQVDFQMIFFGAKLTRYCGRPFAKGEGAFPHPVWR